MHRFHGEAERLVVGDESAPQLKGLKGLVAPRGAAPREDARQVMVNKFLGPGKFGRMFPNAEPFRPPDDALTNLGMAMRDTQPDDPALNNSAVPAGFTYLGQFVDHDITFDKTEKFPQIDDTATIVQARTPNLDLDSLYGLGPPLQPELYDPGTPPDRARLKIGKTDAGTSSGIPGSMPNDLPRNGKTAVIGDPRNDENIVVAQTHLAFLKFHNAVMSMLPQSSGGGGGGGASKKSGKKSSKSSKSSSPPSSNASPFEQAREIVRYHYQWIVLNDFIARIVDPAVLVDVRNKGRKFYKFTDRPFMPIEFSVAAYRLGHSMIRENYNYNRVFSTDPGAITVATLGLLFRFTGGGGSAPIPSNWIIDWRRFFDVGSPELVNFTRRIDPLLIPQLHNLPGFTPPEPSSLPVRNLLRGSRVGLPSGQDVSKIMGIKPLTPSELSGGPEGAVVRQHGFDRKTPLWYYVLREAAVRGEGKRLGPAGSRIVSEVFVGLLEGDKNAYIKKRPKWRPTLPSATPNHFTMADLLRFVNDLNPIG